MKRILALVLTTVMVLGMATTGYALASTGAKIDGMVQSLSMGYSGSQGGDFVDLGEVNPRDELEVHIDLYDAMFSWDDGTAPATPTRLSASQIRNGKLTVRANNNRVLESVSINNRESRIEIKFLTESVSTKDIDFDFDVVLSIDGRRQSDYGMSFTGTFTNPVYEVDKGYESMDISDGVIIEAEEYVPKIELDLGNGVTVITKLFSGDKVYGTTTRTPDKADDDLMAKYPIIEGVIALKTQGLRKGANIVKLSREYDGYHIFDQDLNYLGNNKDLLPLADKYYLVDGKIELEPEKPKTECVERLPEESQQSSESGMINDNPNTGGDGTYPPNVNHNPSTGR